MVVLSSVEQVASDSSKSEEVKLQEHISWIASAMLVFSVSLVLFWKMSSTFDYMQETITVIALQSTIINYYILTFKLSH